MDFTMDLQLIGVAENTKEVYLYDVTPINGTIPLDIYYWTIRIQSANIPNGIIDADIDLIAYLSTKKVQNELYIITSESLGLAESVDIPDGVYIITYNINNQYIKEVKFLMYENVRARTIDLLNEVNYKVIVGDYDISYIKDSIDSPYDIEKARIASNLLTMLEEYTQIPDEVEVNNTLDKLERILEIIKL